MKKSSVLKYIEERELKEFAGGLEILTVSNIIFLIVWVLLLFLKYTIDESELVKTSKLDEKFTKIMQKILSDDGVVVRAIKTKELNAFNAGSKNLYYTLPLKKMLTDKELIAVLCHEYGHYEGKHMKKKITAYFCGDCIAAAVAVMVGTMMPGLSNFVAYLWTMAGVTTLYAVTQGRTHEYYADSYATKKGYGKELISALKKFDKYIRKMICEGLTKSECDTLVEMMHTFDEHPTLKKRITNILKTTKMGMLLATGKIRVAVKYLYKLRKKMAAAVN